MKLGKISLIVLTLVSSSAFASNWIIDRESGKSCEVSCANFFPMNDIKDVTTLPHAQCQCNVNDGLDDDGGGE